MRVIVFAFAVPSPTRKTMSMVLFCMVILLSTLVDVGDVKISAAVGLRRHDDEKLV
jgi:hypothetical protein